MTPQLLLAIKNKLSQPNPEPATADKYYHHYPYGMEIILVSLLGILGGVVCSGNVTNANATQSTGTNSTAVTAPADGNNKKWDLIWKQEGMGCQNWANDTANRDGAWYTCLGITQSAWSLYRRSNPQLPERVEVAHNQDKGAFKAHAITIYKQQYCQPVSCDKYAGPLPALLMAISANGGPGVARRHLANTENITDPKERALAIAKAEHARYDRIAANNPKQRAFRRGGWQQNIDNRYAYIKQF